MKISFPTLIILTLFIIPAFWFGFNLSIVPKNPLWYQSYNTNLFMMFFCIIVGSVSLAFIIVSCQKEFNEKYMKNTREVIEKANTLRSDKEKLKLIFEWVKTGLISQKTFLEVMEYYDSRCL